MALPLTETDKFLLLSAVGAPETRNRIADLLDLAGTGNMTGPATATDNAIVRFDGTTGALVQNSVALLSDAGALSGLTGLSQTSGQSLLPDGTVSLPGISFASDPDTGVYRISSGTIGVSSNGSFVGSVATNGGWTFGGPSTSVTHIFTGNLKFDAGAGVVAIVRNHQNDAGLSFNGGTTSTNSGGNIIAYGPTHASLANYLEFYSGTTLQGSKNANGAWVFGASAGTQTHSVNGSLSITRGLTVSNAGSTENFVVAPTGASFLIKALVGNGSGLQMYANTATDVASIVNFYSAALEFGTANTVRFSIASNGIATFNHQVRVDSLGVGNSAAATTPGTVQNKIEVFDETGVSLGFIAVYDAIT